jgi:hypothetical protein
MKARALLIASAAVGLVIGGAVTAPATDKAGDEKVSCAGVNACKGQGACATAEHSCGGKNACKGKGVVEMSKSECEKKGGKVAAGDKH